MELNLNHIKAHVTGSIQLSGSKSESNRALIIQGLSTDGFTIDSLANAEDTRILQQLLNAIKQNQTNELNVGLAGTVMRFLTAYLAITPGKWILTGEERMKQRPIGILVNALRELGAQIDYLVEEGFPPLSIEGSALKGGEIVVAGDVSSQFISALLMIAPKLSGGLKLSFEGELISKPYIQMTIDIMKYFGANVEWVNGSIRVQQGEYQGKAFQVEADWSAASYFYGFAALSEEVDITLKGLKQHSLQGDSIVSEYYRKLGVETTFEEDGIHLHNIDGFVYPNELAFDFSSCPDIAQTIAVTCAALNIKTKLTGLKTLRIKETDRIAAIQNELNKLGFNVETLGDDIIIHPVNEIGWEASNVKTYNDHRMAMAFAPLAVVNQITIENPEVVKKSYPSFWEELKYLE